MEEPSGRRLVERSMSDGWYFLTAGFWGRDAPYTHSFSLAFVIRTSKS